MFTRWLRWRWWAVLIGGFAVSLFIESSQLSGFWGLYPCAYRQFDVNDLMTNTLGAMVVLTIIGFGHNSHLMRYAIYGFIILFLFAAFARRMPWDFVPGGTDGSVAADADAAGQHVE